MFFCKSATTLEALSNLSPIALLWLSILVFVVFKYSKSSGEDLWLFKISIPTKKIRTIIRVMTTKSIQRYNTPPHQLCSTPIF